jgi:hypothetical protein
MQNKAMLQGRLNNLLDKNFPLAIEYNTSQLNSTTNSINNDKTSRINIGAGNEPENHL